MKISSYSMEEGDPCESIDEGGSSDEGSISSEEDISDEMSDTNDESDNSVGVSDDDEDEENGDEENEDGEEEDPLISTIEGRKEVVSTKPFSIKSKDLFTDISFNPEFDIIAMSCLSGNIEVYSYSVEENILKGAIEAHVKSCRAVEFSQDGKILYSAGCDKNIIFSDVETLDMKMFIDSAHNSPLTALNVPDENLICSGDEEGVIKIWDPRFTRKAVFKAHNAQDYISCIVSKESYKIACSSGDGTLTTYDLRTYGMLQQSAPFDSDITCCSSTHNDTMVVCGTLAGQFLFYKWTDLSDIAGTFKPNQKNPINSVLQISDNIILSGMEDGNIRAYHFFPHKEIGIVGQHNLNVERLDVSREGTLVASLSPEPIVKFWDVSYLEGIEASEIEKQKTRKGTNLPSSEFDDRKSFFSDLC